MTKRKSLVVQRVDLSQFNDEVVRSDDPRLTRCRTGCLTKDHESYGACCRAGAQLNTGVSGTTTQQRWDAELKAYDNARRQGIQPAGTTMDKVEEAVRLSDASGVAYDAEKIGGGILG